MLLRYFRHVFISPDLLIVVCGEGVGAGQGRWAGSEGTEGVWLVCGSEGTRMKLGAVLRTLERQQAAVRGA